MENDNVFERNSENTARESDIQNGDSNFLKTSNGYESKCVNPKIETKVKKARSYVELSMLNNMANSVKSLGRNERRVMVLYTGGTIGMVKNKDGGKFKQAFI